jgi:hypothetical protein
VPVGIDPGDNQGVHIDHPTVLADLDRQPVGPHEGVRAGRDVPPGLHQLIHHRYGRPWTSLDLIPKMRPDPGQLAASGTVLPATTDQMVGAEPF